MFTLLLFVFQATLPSSPHWPTGLPMCTCMKGCFPLIHFAVYNLLFLQLIKPSEIDFFCALQRESVHKSFLVKTARSKYKELSNYCCPAASMKHAWNDSVFLVIQLFTVQEPAVCGPFFVPDIKKVAKVLIRW